MQNKKEINEEIKKEDVFTDLFIENIAYSVVKYVLTSLVTLSVIVGVLVNFGFSLSVGPSMSPTVPDNSVLIFKRTKTNLKQGDIVNFKAIGSNDIYIKRIIGGPGDIIDIKGNNVYVNKEVLEEGYAEGVTFGQGVNYSRDYEMGPDEYYMLGDNRENSTDSRDFGVIKKGDIIGEIISIIPVGKIVSNYDVGPRHLGMFSLVLLIFIYYKKKKDLLGLSTRLKDIPVSADKQSYY